MKNTHSSAMFSRITESRQLRILKISLTKPKIRRRNKNAATNREKKNANLRILQNENSKTDFVKLAFTAERSDYFLISVLPKSGF